MNDAEVTSMYKWTTFLYFTARDNLASTPTGL